MQNKHWKQFYKTKKAVTKPSTFAQFIQKIAGDEKYLLYDLGSGNGRDSLFFAKKGHTVISVDHNGQPYKVHKNLVHWQNDIEFFNTKVLPSNHCSPKLPTVIYSRFFIHSIMKKQTEDLIKGVKSRCYFLAEFRVKGDEPVLYKDHERTYWDVDEILKLFKKKDWNLQYWVGKGFAKYKNEDPLIMRIVAKRK